MPRVAPAANTRQHTKSFFKNLSPKPAKISTSAHIYKCRRLHACKETVMPLHKRYQTKPWEELTFADNFLF